MIEWAFHQEMDQRAASYYAQPASVYASWISVATQFINDQQLFFSPFSAMMLRQWEKARAEVNEIGALEADWDGYGAVAISNLVLENTMRALSILASTGMPAPEISPTSAGTISLSWEFGDQEVYLEIGNTRYSGYIKINQQSPALLEGQADSIDANLFWPIVTSVRSVQSTPPAISHIRIRSNRTDERLAA